MSTSHQSAMPEVANQSRHHALVLAPQPQPGRTFAKLSGLIALTALGASLAAGSVGLAFVLALATVGR